VWASRDAKTARLFTERLTESSGTREPRTTTDKEQQRLRRVTGDRPAVDFN